MCGPSRSLCFASCNGSFEIVHTNMTCTEKIPLFVPSKKAVIEKKLKCNLLLVSSSMYVILNSATRFLASFLLVGSVFMDTHSLF